MTYKIVKYGLFLIFAFLKWHQFFPFGDYCSGMVDAILSMLYGGLFILAFVVFSVIDLSLWIRKKQPFDFIPLLLLGFFITFSTLFFNSEKEKPWTKAILVGSLDVGDLRAATLTLYRNNSFSVRSSYLDYSCTYQGGYFLLQDTLWLKRKSISELTNNVFATKYLFSHSDSILIPLEQNFKEIKIRYWAQQ